MTRCVLASGDIVVATLRKPSALAPLASQYGPDRLVTVAVDVTVNFFDSGDIPRDGMMPHVFEDGVRVDSMGFGWSCTDSSLRPKWQTLWLHKES